MDTAFRDFLAARFATTSSGASKSSSLAWFDTCVGFACGSGCHGHPSRQHAQPKFDARKVYVIENVNAVGKYLTFHGQVGNTGSNVVLGNDPGKSAARWRMNHLGSGRFTVENENASGKFLNVAGSASRIGANVWLWDNPGRASTQWYVDKIGEIFTFENVNAPSKFLNVAGDSVENGANVHIWDNPDAFSTQWRISEWHSPESHVQTPLEGLDRISLVTSEQVRQKQLGEEPRTAPPSVSTSNTALLACALVAVVIFGFTCWRPSVSGRLDIRVLDRCVEDGVTELGLPSPVAHTPRASFTTF